MRSRRRLLRTCGTASLLGIAGCLGTGGDSPGANETPSSGTAETATTEATTDTTPTSETTPTTETTATTASTTPSAPPEVREVEPAVVADRGVPRSPTIESDTHEPFRGFVVGESPETPGSHYETPHVWVWNLVGEPTTVEVAVAAGDAELLRIEEEFPAGAPLAVVFRDRRAYEVTVRAGGHEETVAVETPRFRCNASGTDALVRPDGIEAETISTSMYCTTTPGGS